MAHKKVLLVILDGWGIGPRNKHNAIYLGVTSFFDACMRQGHTAELLASGEAVGLIPGQIGSSEVGHMHIGAGRIVPQELTKINRAVQNQSFYENPEFLKAIEHAKRHKSKLHLLGVLSDGGVHAHQDHLFALIKLCSDQNLEKVYIHVFTDGRDTPPYASLQYIKQLEAVIAEYPLADLATVCGRYYAMDRDNHRERTRRAFNTMVNGDGATPGSFLAGIQANHERGIVDEYIEPFVLDKSGLIGEDDSIICCHFRAERMRQILKLLHKQIPNLWITTMIPYGVDDVPTHPAYYRSAPENHLTEVLARLNIPYARIAETEKYAHITYFLSGTHEQEYAVEKRIIVPSKNVPTFDQLPEMSAKEITDAALAQLNDFSVMMINYANADVVGHTGNIPAGRKACAAVDKNLKRLVEAARAKGFDVMITSDHGNAEEMYDAHNDCSHTAHTTNHVPFIFLSDEPVRLKKTGGLVNIAPTMLGMLGIQKPREMVEGLIF